jgi:hypothetical protein
MVSASTNCRASNLIDWPTAIRTTGSPMRRINPRRAATGFCGSSPRTLPVSISAQVEAFTSEEDECPR